MHAQQIMAVQWRDPSSPPTFFPPRRNVAHAWKLMKHSGQKNK